MNKNFFARKTNAGNKQFTHTRKLGTFKGVFLPGLLTVLGIIMYTRFGWVLGQVGLWGTFSIVVLATSITFITGLSLSTLSTNMRIGNGGAYYIVSRSLGLEIGAAIGLPLYFAQAIGIAFYLAGFTETLIPFLLKSDLFLNFLTYIHFPIDRLPQLLGASMLTLLTLVASYSSELALRSQVVIFILIIGSIGIILGGHLPIEWQGESFVDIHQFKLVSFFVVFSVFFPAVTGVEAGAAMAGEVEDPTKSLPRGTLAAIIASFIIYLLIPLGLYFHVLKDHPIEGRALLLKDHLILTKYTFHWLPSWLNIVLLAVWGASISSALGGILAAPRTLQAIAQDNVIPRFFGRTKGKNKEPFIAMIITYIVAMGGILLGKINLIAPVLSMFALTSYCLINLSSAFEGMIGSPFWRPTFKIPWVISLLGAIACFFVMVKVNLFATLLSIVISVALYVYMQRRSLKARWGDVRSGILALVARTVIYRLPKGEQNERTWLPNLMVFSGAPTSRWYLVKAAQAISANKGFLTICAIVGNNTTPDLIKGLEFSVQNYLQKHKIAGLVKVFQASSTLVGAQQLIRTYGFGSLEPNTILLGTSEGKAEIIDYAALIRFIHQVKKNVIIVREGDESYASHPAPLRIDIWWRGWTKYAAFKLAIAFLLTQSEDFSHAHIVLKTIAKQEEKEKVLNLMRSFIVDTRLQASAEVVVMSHENTPWETIKKHSSGAGMVFLGMRPPKDESDEEYSQYLRMLFDSSSGMPPTIFSLNAEELSFQNIFS